MSRRFFNPPNPLHNSMGDLHDSLTDISGVGDKTADKIIEVFDGQDNSDTSEVKELLEESLAYYEQGDENIMAEHVEKALDAL